MGAGRFVLPAVCCRCVGPADDVFSISSNYSSSVLLDQTHVTTTTHTLQVPYCSSCSAAAKRTQRISLVVFLAIALLAVFVARWLPSGVALWVTLPAIVMALSAWPVAAAMTRPAKVAKNGLPLFESGEYQLLFEEANNLGSDAYGVADGFTRDMHVAEARTRRESRDPPSRV